MEISPLNVNVFKVRAKHYNYIFDHTQHDELFCSCHPLLLLMWFIGCCFFFPSGLTRSAADSIFYSLITPQCRGQTGDWRTDKITFMSAFVIKRTPIQGWTGVTCFLKITKLQSLLPSHVWTDTPPNCACGSWINSQWYQCAWQL